MQDPGVDSGGLLWGERSTPTCQIHLIVHWDGWELIRVKMIGDELHFCRNVFWILGGGDPRPSGKCTVSLLLGQVI